MCTRPWTSKCYGAGGNCLPVCGSLRAHVSEAKAVIVSHVWKKNPKRYEGQYTPCGACLSENQVIVFCGVLACLWIQGLLANFCCLPRFALARESVHATFPALLRRCGVQLQSNLCECMIFNQTECQKESGYHLLRHRPGGKRWDKA